MQSAKLCLFDDSENLTVVETFILFLCIKAGAGLISEVTMPVNLGVVHPDKIQYQFVETGFLLWRSIVHGIASSVEPANVTNANRMRVVSFAMCTRVRNGPAAFYRAVALDDVVIANIGKAASKMYSFYFLGSKRTAGTIG